MTPSCNQDPQFSHEDSITKASFIGLSKVDIPTVLESLVTPIVPLNTDPRYVQEFKVQN